ncbi:MAG: bifunctional tetrahydrofolate synthase/dihydrofolate synthase [Methylotenera sp.]|nr:bifunctional tetrahydrofolate synthase/dihydrofolate synthase [Methylotenera sp.]
MPSGLAPENLNAWLRYIESLHPKSIAMGLARVKQVIGRLKLQPNFKIISVAGTNGKGSTCAMLAQIYLQAGFSVGCYTSPHLLRYNERVLINGAEVSDEALCAAFSAVETARQSGDAIALTYFEVGTLAAMWHFAQIGIDVAILEIGLGGRLDAVNAFEPNCAIVTSVDLDHQEFLGESREEIGFEKAGVYRQSTPAICGDNHPPLSLINYVEQIYADFKCINRDFTYTWSTTDWCYLCHGQVIHTLPLPALEGHYQLNNAACAVAAVESLQASLPVTTASIANAMRQVSLAGRFQTVSKAPWVILDVAHNPHAAQALAENLAALKLTERTQVNAPSQAKTLAVFAMLADKDMKGVVNALQNEIDTWYVANIDHDRGALASDLAAIIAEIMPNAIIKCFDTAAQAYEQAIVDTETCIDGNENDKIVVFGSFFTVANVMQYLSQRANTHL